MVVVLEASGLYWPKLSRSATFESLQLHGMCRKYHIWKISPTLRLSHLILLSGPSVNAVVESVKAQAGGTFDYLVGNAGQTSIMPILDFDIKTARSIYDINIWGADARLAGVCSTGYIR